PVLSRRRIAFAASQLVYVGGGTYGAQLVSVAEAKEPLTDYPMGKTCTGADELLREPICVAIPSDGGAGQRQAGFGRKTMASDTPIVAAVRIKASLIPVGVLGHPFFYTNPHACRLQPDSLGDVMYVARCEHLAIDDCRMTTSRSESAFRTGPKADVPNGT